VSPTWKEETEAFFSRGCDARLCVLHFPSGRVVCLGVASSSCRWAYPAEDAQDGKPAVHGGAGLEFKWQVPTPLLTNEILDQIERGRLTQVDCFTGELLTTWDPVQGRHRAKTMGIALELYVDMKLAPAGPPASREVWEWECIHFGTEPLLTYPFDDEFGDKECNSSLTFTVDDLLEACLHGAGRLLGDA
jgi:hypothetical protein